jgi:hypothetical protein
MGIVQSVAFAVRGITSFCFCVMSGTALWCIILIGDGGFGVIATEVQGGVTFSSGMVCAALVRTINGDGGVGVLHDNVSQSHAKASSVTSGAGV